MKKIGFVDYFIDEWHANNYPTWMKESPLGGEYTVAYTWAEIDTPPAGLGEMSTREWCEKFGTEQCASIEELCEKSDVIVILVPKNPEKHLGYAELALKYGKPTYIDKTFAPDLATAKRIFEIADKYGAPSFTSSALRYATELDEAIGSRKVHIKGCGSSAEEYIIHLVEMLVKTVGIGAESIIAEDAGNGTTLFTLTYTDGREAAMSFHPDLPYAIEFEKDGTTVAKEINSPFFNALIDDMLRFFGDGQVSFPREESLEVMKIREGAVKAFANPGTLIKF